MRIVIDTNVFVAAVSSPDDASREVLRRCLLEGRYEPVMGQALLAGYESMLARSGPWAASPIDEVERDTLWAALAHRSRWVRVYHLWRPSLRDEADDLVVELAVAGGAEVIVTHSAHALTRVEAHFPKLRVLCPGELLAEE